MNKKSMQAHLFGIRKQVTLSISIVCILVIVFTCTAVNIVVTRNVSELLSKQYFYQNEKIMENFAKVYDELDQLTANFITNEYVQKTLRNKELSVLDQEMLKKSLLFLNTSILDDYLIIDNKQNCYSLKDRTIGYETIVESSVYKSLGDEYSKTKLLWTQDDVFGTGENCFFVIRAIHEMNVDHEPGVLILKLSNKVMAPVKAVMDDPELVYIIQTPEGEKCLEKYSDIEKEDLEKELGSIETDSDHFHLKQGICQKKENKETGFSIVTYAPKKVTGKIARRIRVVMLFLFFIGGIMMISLIAFLTDKLTKPIMKLQKTMCEFDDTKLDTAIQINSNTELDYIGNAYNRMLGKVRSLMDDVKYKERELKESELQTMLYQIHPHFLYNTLDTIYMLARIQKEETIMQMIQSLSKFLRINLSNGSDFITVSQELEHVSSYLEIQKIRNTDLFTYSIEADPQVEKEEVAKMILQPIVENCIKYGFQNIYEGGEIIIRSYREEDELCFEIQNNGEPVDEEMLQKLNMLEQVPLEEIDRVIQKKKGGFGICNVVKRLRLYYEQIRYFYVRKEEGTVCVIKIKKDWQ